MSLSLRRWTAVALTCLLLGIAAATAQEFPPLTGRIVDQAGLIAPATEQRLADRLAAHEAASGNQIVVVTLESLQGYDIADYGYRLGRAWEIGRGGEDDGLLLIIAPNERRVRIEVGYGLEGTMTDALSHDIIQNRILPQFRQDDYEAGIEAGVTAILSALDGGYTPVGDRRDGSRESVAPMILFFAFFAIVALMRYFKGNRRSRGGGYGPGVIVGGHGARHGGGFGGRGGFGGGFGGGGGSFGGGGASGSW